MKTPTIHTEFTDNDKYWFDVGARYTMRVYDILQNAQINNDRKSNINLLENYDSSFFGLNDYPIFDESFRKSINDMIISHYIEWEIAYETDFLFRTHMRADMFRVMPAINMKLKSRELAYNSEHMLATDTGSGTEHTEDEHKFLDTPQGSEDTIDDNYLTNMSRNNSDRVNSHNYTNGTAGTNAQTYGGAVWDYETEICDALKHNFMGLFG